MQDLQQGGWICRGRPSIPVLAGSGGFRPPVSVSLRLGLIFCEMFFYDRELKPRSLFRRRWSVCERLREVLKAKHLGSHSGPETTSRLIKGESSPSTFYRMYIDVSIRGRKSIVQAQFKFRGWSGSSHFNISLILGCFGATSVLRKAQW